MDALDDLARKLGIEELETRGDRLERALGRWGFLGLLIRLLLGAPGDEFRIAFEHPEIDLVHALGQKLAAAVGGAAIAASGKLDETRFRKVGARPVQSVGENRLIAARQHALAILGRNPQRPDDLVLESGDADFIVAL